MRLESDLFIGMTMISFLDAVWRVIELRYIGSIEHKWIAEGAILGHIWFHSLGRGGTTDKKI